MTPRISIVTPSFNQAPYLEATLRSVLEQGYPDLEYIVMDGGSTDGSVDILRSHASRLSYWTSAHDAGQADAINRGLARSTGEILAYLNSDDVYLPGALARVAAHFAAHPEADLVYGDYVYLDEQGRVLQHFQAPPFEAAALVLGNTVSQPTVFVRRRAWERVGPFDAALHCVMDLDYWLRAAVAGLRFERVPAEQAGMRMHAAAKTATREAAFWCEILAMLDRLYAGGAIPGALRAVQPRAYRRAHWYAAVAFADQPDATQAARLARRAAEGWDPMAETADLDFVLQRLLGDRSGALLGPAALGARFRRLGFDRPDLGAVAAVAEEQYRHRWLAELAGRGRGARLRGLWQALAARPARLRDWAYRHEARRTLDLRP